MNNRTLAKTKNQKPTTFSPVFGKKGARQTFTPGSVNEAPDVSNPEFGHNFGNVQVESPSFKQSCPLSLSSPAYCPFGGACHTCPPRVQAKLKIGQPYDKYEQEANRVAEQVMRMPEPQVQRKACSSCKEEDEDKILQAKPAGSGGNVQVDHPLIQSVLSSPGRPLDATTRSFMEPRFGQDFSGVRVHTGSEAAESARTINAQAYAVGRDVVFGEGKYAPGMDEGKRLMAHELVHVGQQVSHIARSPECIKGHSDGEGKLIKKPFTIDNITYIYVIWGVWQRGDNISSFQQRVINRWIPWRFGTLAADIRTKISTYLNGITAVQLSGLQLTEGCNYSIGLSQDVLTRTRILSGEVAREREAKKAAKAKVQQEQPSVTNEAKDSGPAGGLKTESKAESGGGLGLGELEKTVEESKKQDLAPTAKVESDWSVLQNPQLADHYLKILEHFEGRSISANDTTAAADGLSTEEIEKIIDKKPLRKILTGLFTQGYGEFKAAGGTKNKDFFKLEETIAEQFVRGNPTSTHNNLKIGYGIPEKKVLGIVERSSGILFYDANGQPLPGIAGVGMRDKGYIGSRQDDSFGINIAKVKEFDEGLFLVLNSLRQTFSDPTRMSKEAAEIYFQNVELVNTEVQKGLTKEVWDKFEEMLPFFIGFLAGHALSTWLLRAPNPMIAGIGLALKAFLTAAGYIMNIEFAEGALTNLLKAAYDLSRIEKNDKGEITSLSAKHLKNAAVPIRSMVADIALMAATIGLAELLRRGRPAKIECTKCKIEEKSQGKAATEKKKADIKQPSRIREAEYINALKEHYPKLKNVDIRPKARPSAGRTEGAPEFAFEERMQTTQGKYSLVVYDKGKAVIEFDGISVDGWIIEVKIEQSINKVDGIVIQLRRLADFAEAYGFKGVRYSIAPPKVADLVEAEVALQRLRNTFPVH